MGCSKDIVLGVVTASLIGFSPLCIHDELVSNNSSSELFPTKESFFLHLPVSRLPLTTDNTPRNMPYTALRTQSQWAHETIKYMQDNRSSLL